MGDRAEQVQQFRLNLNLTIQQDGRVLEEVRGNVENVQKKQVELIGVMNGVTRRARVRFEQAERRSFEEGKQPNIQRLPVEGKSYVAARENERLLITDEKGQVPPLAEYEIVAQSMQTLGKPNPLSSFFHGRTVKVGQTLEMPTEMARELFGSGDSVHDVAAFALTLKRIEGSPAQRVAVFSARMQASSRLAAGMKMEILGEFRMDPTTCRALGAKLSGPVSFTQQAAATGPAIEMEGKGNLNVEIQAAYQPARLATRTVRQR